jgi:ribosome biogenesis GTPase A
MIGTAEEMKELISKGTFRAYENRVYLAGACNVGKSTLTSILIGCWFLAYFFNNKNKAGTV